MMKKHIAAKQTGKFGTQVKYEGINHLQQTFANQKYISYVRGRSNVVNVYDTVDESQVYSHDFSEYFDDKQEIKALIPYGDNMEELKHLACDQLGNVVL